MIKFSLKNNQMLCFGIEEENVRRMAEGNPVYVFAESFNLPVDFQMTIGKKSACLPLRNSFVVDISDESLERLRSGAVLHIGQKSFWPVPDTFIFYGKNEADLRQMASRLVEQLSGKSFKETFGQDVDSYTPINNIRFKIGLL